jgi:hypothetical protein
MKKIVFVLSVVILLTGCYRDDIDRLKDDIDRLNERLTQYESLLNALEKRLYVESYEVKDGFYIITMNDGSKMSVSNCTIVLANGVMTFTFADGRTVSMDAAAPEVKIAAEQVIDKMKWLTITPEVKNTNGVAYTWLLGDNEISGEKDLCWVFASAGT